MRYLIMCKSLTYAQRSARTLERYGINVGIAKAPTGLSGNGCGYSLSVSERNAKRAVDILRSEELMQGKIYVQFSNGDTREALL